MKLIITRGIGLALILTSMIISFSITTEKFGSMWNYAMSKYQPIAHTEMMWQLMIENPLQVIVCFILIILGGFFVLKNVK